MISKLSLMMKVYQLCHLTHRLLIGKEMIIFLISKYILPLSGNTSIFIHFSDKYFRMEYFVSTTQVLYVTSFLRVAVFLTFCMNPFQPVHEMEEHLKGKVKERNQIIADENQKLHALR
ncbi:hypothetical protein VPH35_115869 [Triticum aestivum]|uniref:Uncharacterized protein n=1 Tax=Aegilops tauschii subsp. strangulata TaxID=200361 RepID=A0A453N9T6_AEGTS